MGCGDKAPRGELQKAQLGILGKEEMMRLGRRKEWKAAVLVTRSNVYRRFLIDRLYR